MRRIALVAATSLFAATALLADSTVEQKTKVRMGGALGGILNMVGGKAAREGLVSTHVVKGDRRLMRSGDTGELVDLKEEKVYQIDFARSSYKVVTFAQMRKQMEDMKKQAEKNAAEAKASRDSGEKPPEFDVVMDVKDTGERETINGYNTRRTIMTITVTEKGKKLDQGGAVLTADMWMAPKVKAIQEMGEFEQRYIKKVYGGLFGEGDMRQMAMLMATAPQFGKAMKKLEEKKGTLEGTSVRSEIKFETVAAPGQAAKEESASADEPSAAAMKALGGFLGKMNKKRAKDSATKDDAKPSDPNRNLLFGSNTEVLRAESSAAATDVAIPTGFKLRS